MEEIIKIVCEYYDVYPRMLNVDNRRRKYVKSRQICMYLISKFYNESLTDIGRKFERTHATVIHSVKTVENEICTNDKYRKEVEYLFTILKEQDIQINNSRLCPCCGRIKPIEL